MEDSPISNTQATPLWLTGLFQSMHHFAHDPRHLRSDLALLPRSVVELAQAYLREHGYIETYSDWMTADSPFEDGDASPGDPK